MARWFKFYPDQWLASEGIRTLPLAAQGFLFHLMCLAHESPKPGYLVDHEGKALTLADIAKNVGCLQVEASDWIGELRKAGLVASNPDGVFIVAEVAKESAIDARRREAGRNPKE